MEEVNLGDRGAEEEKGERGERRGNEVGGASLPLDLGRPWSRRDKLAQWEPVNWKRIKWKPHTATADATDDRMKSGNYTAIKTGSRWRRQCRLRCNCHTPRQAERPKSILAHVAFLGFFSKSGHVNTLSHTHAQVLFTGNR